MLINLSSSRGPHKGTRWRPGFSWLGLVRNVVEGWRWTNVSFRRERNILSNLEVDYWKKQLPLNERNKSPWIVEKRNQRMNWKTWTRGGGGVFGSLAHQTCYSVITQLLPDQYTNQYKWVTPSVWRGGKLNVDIVGFLNKWKTLRRIFQFFHSVTLVEIRTRNILEALGGKRRKSNGISYLWTHG